MELLFTVSFSQLPEVALLYILRKVDIVTFKYDSISILYNVTEDVTEVSLCHLSMNKRYVFKSEVKIPGECMNYRVVIPFH